MKLSKRTNTIILWVVSLGLLAGMVVMFTPGLGGSSGGGGSRGAAEIVINGQTLYETDLQQVRTNPLFNIVTEGEVGQDLKRLMVDEVVRQAVLDQAAARVNVSGGQVRDAVNAFRKERGVDGARNDQAYLRLIGSNGFNDQTFRDYMRDQLRLQGWENGLVKGVTVSDDEVRAYYESHLSSYQTEERIEARQLVVADKDLAEKLRRQVLAGADFATLARENSLELADRDGAVGAPANETTPRPVGRPALPTVVSNAAFSLRGVGLTDVVVFNERYYLVQVEGYQPAANRPFEDVKETVSQDALTAKQQGVVEAELENLRQAAQISFPPTSSLSFDDPVLATVGGHEIKASQVDRALYTNTQIQQALSPQTADLIVGLFKPTVLSQLIDTEVAYQGSQTLGVPFVGSRTAVALAALNYVSRDATATEEEVEEYYAANQSLYTLSAEATVTKVEFEGQAAAVAFREALLSGDDVEAANAATGGTATELGLVKPGDLPAEFDTALFGTNAFEALPDGVLSVSDVIVLQTPVEPVEEEDAGAGAADAAGEDAAGDGVAAEPTPPTVDSYVVLVADRVPARVRPLEDVRAQVEQAVLVQKRQAERSEWLAERRQATEIIETARPDLVLPAGALPSAPAAGGETPAEGGTPAESGTPAEGGTPAESGTPAEGGTPAESGTPTEGGTSGDEAPSPSN